MVSLTNLGININISINRGPGNEETDQYTQGMNQETGAIPGIEVNVTVALRATKHALFIVIRIILQFHQLICVAVTNDLEMVTNGEDQRLLPDCIPATLNNF